MPHFKHLPLFINLITCIILYINFLFIWLQYTQVDFYRGYRFGRLGVDLQLWKSAKRRNIFGMETLPNTPNQQCLPCFQGIPSIISHRRYLGLRLPVSILF